LLPESAKGFQGSSDRVARTVRGREGGCKARLDLDALSKASDRSAQRLECPVDVPALRAPWGAASLGLGSAGHPIAVEDRVDFRAMGLQYEVWLVVMRRVFLANRA